MLSPGVRRSLSRVLLVLFSAQSGGCYSWQVVGPGPEMPREVSGSLKVLLRDFSVIEARSIRINADTLYAFGTGPETTSQPISIPMDQVLRVSAHQVSPSKSTLFVLGVGLLAVAVYGLVVVLEETEEAVCAQPGACQSSTQP